LEPLLSLVMVVPATLAIRLSAGLVLCPLVRAAALSTTALPLSTSQIGPDGLPSSLVPASPAACATCGKNDGGATNCCSAGGDWAGKCSESLSAEHTWKEGFRACNNETQEVATETTARQQYDKLKCEDKENDCAAWATSGECGNNPGFMLDSCCRSCVQLDFPSFKKAGRASPAPEPAAQQAKSDSQPPPQQAKPEVYPPPQQASSQEKPMTLGALGAPPKQQESKPMTLGSLGVASQQQQAKVEGFQEEAVGGDHEKSTPRAAPTAAEAMQKDDTKSAKKGVTPVPSVAHAPAPGKIILKAKNNRFDGRFEDLEGELKHACTEVEVEELCRRAVYWDYSLKEVIHECDWKDKDANGNYACHEGKKISTSAASSTAKSEKPVGACSYCNP